MLWAEAAGLDRVGQDLMETHDGVLNLKSVNAGVTCGKCPHKGMNY